MARRRTAGIRRRVPTPLFVATHAGSKEAWECSVGFQVSGSTDVFEYIPTCSAFSTLRRMRAMLSGPGNSSSVPARGPVPVRKIWP